MTPQEKNVFGKLSTKTELNSQRIELARISVDEIRKSYETVQTARNESTASLRKATEAATAIEASAKSLSVKSGEFLKNYEVFMNDVKALGLEIPANLQGLNKIVNDDVKLSAKLFKSASTIKGLV
jgi:hypothetical protein